MDFDLNDVKPAGAIAVSVVLAAANLATCFFPSGEPDGAKGVSRYAAALLPLAVALFALVGVSELIRGLDGTIEGAQTARSQLEDAKAVIEACIAQYEAACDPATVVDATICNLPEDPYTDPSEALITAADDVTRAIDGISNDVDPGLSDVRGYASSYLYAVVGGTCGLWALYGAVALLAKRGWVKKVLRAPAALVTGVVAAASAHLHATFTYSCSQADKKLVGDIFDALVTAASPNATSFLTQAQAEAAGVCPTVVKDLRAVTAPGFLGAAYGDAHGGVCDTAPQGALIVCVFCTLAACTPVALQIANGRGTTAAAQETTPEAEMMLLGEL